MITLSIKAGQPQYVVYPVDLDGTPIGVKPRRRHDPDCSHFEWEDGTVLGTPQLKDLQWRGYRSGDGWPALRNAGCMRYPDGDGLDAAERARREQVRLRLRGRRSLISASAGSGASALRFDKYCADTRYQLFC